MHTTFGVVLQLRCAVQHVLRCVPSTSAFGFLFSNFVYGHSSFRLCDSVLGKGGIYCPLITCPLNLSSSYLVQYQYYFRIFVNRCRHFSYFLFTVEPRCQLSLSKLNLFSVFAVPIYSRMGKSYYRLDSFLSYFLCQFGNEKGAVYLSELFLWIPIR